LTLFQEKLKEKRSNDIEMEAVNLLQSSPMNASLILAQKDKNSSLTIAPVSLFVFGLTNNFLNYFIL